MRRYKVQAAARRPLVNFMVDALRSSGCRIIHEPDPTEAPFVITFETPTGERMGIVAYAFFANESPTKKKRPADERSFQIKYGSDDRKLHTLWQDPLGLYTTILIGIDPEAGFFVAADPEVHNPTRFFIRLEFKERHATAIKREGWFAWERETHPLATEFELSAGQILELIASARRLKMAVRGWVAEEKLRATLATTQGVTACERLDVEGGADLRISWRNGPPLLIECKNVLRTKTREGLPKIDFQRTRASKTDPCSRFYSPDDFDVVAGCLHAVSEEWDFKYALPSQFDPRAGCPGKLNNAVTVDGRWTENPGDAFEAAYARLGN